MASQEGERAAAVREVLLQQMGASLFQLRKVVGRGGYGVVVKATRRDSGQVLALKAVRKQTSGDAAPPSPETQEPDAPPPVTTPATATATTTEPPPTTPVVVMHNACVERHLVPAGHQERPERTASARRVAQNVVRRRPERV